MLGSALSKLDLVTREEFEVQREVLAHARQKLAELELRIAQLEGPPPVVAAKPADVGTAESADKADKPA